VERIDGVISSNIWRDMEERRWAGCQKVYIAIHSKKLLSLSREGAVLKRGLELAVLEKMSRFAYKI
jgi:hypothetical protein